MVTTRRSAKKNGGGKGGQKKDKGGGRGGQTGKKKGRPSKKVQPKPIQDEEIQSGTDNESDVDDDNSDDEQSPQKQSDPKSNGDDGVNHQIHKNPLDYKFAPIVTLVMDKTFDIGLVNPAYPLPGKDKIWNFIKAHAPTINLQTNPSAIDILLFLRELRRFLNTSDKQILLLIFENCLVGPLEKTWSKEADYDIEKIEQKFINWIWLSNSWNKTMFELREGKRFADALATHIDIFKIVAKHMGLKAEDELTKRYFAKSVGINPMQLFDSDGKLIPFRQLEEIASRGETFHTVEPQQEQSTVAATTMKPNYEDKRYNGPNNRQFKPKDKQFYSRPNQFHKKYHGRKFNKTSQNPKSVVCQLCGGSGHIATDCPFHKKDKSKSSPKYHAPKDDHDDRSFAGINAIGDGSDGLIHSECQNGDNIFDAVLDSAASLNCVSLEAAKEMIGIRKPVNKIVGVLKTVQQVKECIEMKIKIGEIETNIIAYVVDGIPGDLLLGEPFLSIHSEGYNLMIKEFKGRVGRKICTVTELDELYKLLDKYPKLVLDDDELPDPTRYYKGQTFHLGIPEEERNRIFHRGQYEVIPTQIDEYRKLLIPLIKSEVYVKSDSPHNNPVMLVPKKKPGEYRLVVDNRLVNAVCKPVGSMRASPLQVIRAIMGATIFTTLDCKNAFYSLLLAEEDRKYTAISPPGMGRLELTRMPMGAKASTSALFQAMTATIGDAYYKYALMWADDIIIYSKNLEEHIRHVDDILKKLDENGFCISKSKIELGKSEVRWLGYLISSEGIKPDPEKTNQLISMRRPRSIEELRSAMGMWTYFTSFLPGYSIYAAPLFAQLKKNNPKLKWTKECDEAWKTMKEKIAHAPIMGHIDINQPLYMHTDACQSGFAAMLTQTCKGKHILIDAASRTTTPSEKSYDGPKSECACIIWAAKKWKHYLNAVPHTYILTDSYGIQFLQSKAKETALVQRWITEMEGFQYTVQYREGHKNIADFLSRQNDVPREKSEEIKERDTEFIKPEVLAAILTRSQNKDLEIDYEEMDKKLKRKRSKEDERNQSSLPTKRRKSAITIKVPKEQKVREGPLYIDTDYIIKNQKEDSYIRRIWKLACHKQVYEPTRQEKEDAIGVTMINGIVSKSITDDTGRVVNKIIIPLSMQKEVTLLTHRRNAHPGVRGTLAILRQYHWFRGMKAMVMMIVKHCPECMLARGRPISLEKMSPDERPIALGGRWHIDGLDLGPSGNYDHVMVAIDAATKYVILRPSLGETSQAASNVVMDIVRRFGRPQRIITDRGRAFMSNAFMKVCEGLLICHTPVGIGQPQANGMVERVNQSIVKIATIICKGNMRLWSQYVGEIEYAYNTRVHTATGHSPYELVYGRLPPGPAYTDNIIGAEEDWKTEDNVRILRKRIEILQQLAYENQLKASKQQQSYHDAHAKAHTFKVGDKVYVYRASEALRGITSKLSYKWDGPFTIANCLGDLTYTLMDSNGKLLPRSFHARHLNKEPEEEIVNDDDDSDDDQSEDKS